MIKNWPNYIKMTWSKIERGINVKIVTEKGSKYGVKRSQPFTFNHMFTHDNHPHFVFKTVLYRYFKKFVISSVVIVSLSATSIKYFTDQVLVFWYTQGQFKVKVILNGKNILLFMPFTTHKSNITCRHSQNVYVYI